MEKIIKVERLADMIALYEDITPIPIENIKDITIIDGIIEYERKVT
jgi:hypothetical protein